MCFTYYSCFIRLFTGFIKHIFYGDSLFDCLIIYSSQLILTSTVFYKVPFGTEMAHVCRYTILQSNAYKCQFHML